MTLDIISADEPIEITRTSVMLFGDPWVGKTSLGFTAESPLLFDFKGRGGAHRSAFRKSTSVINSWSQIEAFDAEKDLEGFRTVAIDTVGAMQDLSTYEISKDSANLKSSGELAWAGWSALGRSFDDFVRKIEAQGVDIVFIAHAKEVVDDKGKLVSYRPDVVGSARQTIYQDCNAIARVYRQGKDRIIDWSDAASYCKDPAGYGAEVIPDFALVPDYLAQKIAGIKSALGRISEEGKRIAELVTGWAMEIEQVAGADDLNRLFQRGRDLDDTEAARKQVKAMLVRKAKELGLTWSKEVGGYVG